MAAEVEIVRQWHTTLNDGQVDSMVALVADDVEVGGPRGSTQGAQIVREWFGRANVRMIPLHYFHRDNVVIVEERGEWYSPETGEVTSTQTVATAFTVVNGRITRIMRYDDVDSALNAAGLTRSDSV